MSTEPTPLVTIEENEEPLLEIKEDLSNDDFSAPIKIFFQPSHESHFAPEDIFIAEVVTNEIVQEQQWMTIEPFVQVKVPRRAPAFYYVMDYTKRK